MVCSSLLIIEPIHNYSLDLGQFLKSLIGPFKDVMSRFGAPRYMLDEYMGHGIKKTPNAYPNTVKPHIQIKYWSTRA